MPNTDISAFIAIISFLAFLTAVDYIAPPQYHIISPFDFTWLTGGIAGVAGACVIATGIPCAGALAVFTIGSILKYLLIDNSLLKLLIFVPLSLIMIYIVSKLARGA